MWEKHATDIFDNAYNEAQYVSLKDSRHAAVPGLA